jgi:predicted nucleotide-binding protein
MDFQLLSARQNVILELGYFMGRLGKDRVATLYQNGTDIPTDYSGVAYIPFDSSEAWQLKMARELRAAGVQFESDDLV